jgi:hypothetical protein
MPHDLCMCTVPVTTTQIKICGNAEKCSSWHGSEGPKGLGHGPEEGPFAFRVLGQQGHTLFLYIPTCTAPGFPPGLWVS